MRVALSAIVGVNAIQYHRAIPEQRGHLPKPVVVMPGLERPAAVSQILPVQLLRIGTVAILGIPGELTTMAGRRLRDTALRALAGAGVTDVALGTYANEYSQYITTFEEYGSQQYEGASTLFGPHTLEAYQQVATGLAAALVAGTPAPPGPAPTAWTAPPHRYRLRNLYSRAVALRFYNLHDEKRWITLPYGRQTLGPHAEVAYPERAFTGRLLPTIRRLTVWARDDTHVAMSAGELLTIAADGAISVGPYTRPPRS